MSGAAFLHPSLLFGKGCVGKLENGKKVCIWKDKWTPSSSTYRVVSPRILLPEDATVDTLIDSDHGLWRADLVRDLFLNFEAENILSIPLSTRMPPDKLVWAATPNGTFTVKSAYWIAMEMKEAEQEGTCGNASQSRLWKTIWLAEVPNKIINFVWRACQNIRREGNKPAHMLAQHIVIASDVPDCL